MIRCILAGRLALVTAIFVTAAAQSQTNERPNILWLVSEDNTTLLGCYGDPLARTPTLDKLASEGVLFERCFAQPVCAPSRFTLITGTFAASAGPAHHMRAQGNIPSWLKGFPALLRESGYYTVNNAKTDYNAPISLKETWNASNPLAHYRNRSASEQPFFAVFNHEITHESCLFPEQDVPLGFPPTDPLKVRVPPYQPDTPEIRADWARYYDHLALLDRQIAGRLKELDDSGLSQNTIVFYYSDNGGVLPRSKTFLHRSGTHVPLIVYFPPRWRHVAPAPPGSRLFWPISFVDFAPTVLSLAAVSIPAYMQGRAFAGPHAQTNEFVFCTRDRMDDYYDMGRSVVDSKWLYIRNFRPDLPYVQPMDYRFKARGYQSWARVAREARLIPATAQFWGEKPSEELYNLAKDPDNVHNLAAADDHASVLVRMRETLKRHTLAIRDNGFLPEGSVLEGYDASHQSGAFPLEQVYELALLASARETANLPKLMAVLDDANEPVRWWAAQGLAMLGRDAKPAEEPLRRRLEDSSGAVRVAAAEALARIGRLDLALPALERQLSDMSNVAFALQAANVLGRLGPRALPVLPVMKKELARFSAADSARAATAVTTALPSNWEQWPAGDAASRMQDCLRRNTEHTVSLLENRKQMLVYPAIMPLKPRGTGGGQAGADERSVEKVHQTSGLKPVTE